MGQRGLHVRGHAPGTGDVALSTFQSLPVDGIVIVASPQELVGMVVEKAVRMAEMMDVPILGIVENMSYIVCPDCGKRLPCSARAAARKPPPATGWTCWQKCPSIPSSLPW